MTTKLLKKRATYDELRDVPDHFVAEMCDGDRYVSPRPALPHANAAGSLFAEIHKSFDHKSPGGWVILLCLEAGRRTHLGNYAGEKKLRAAPFDAIELELELGTLWI